MHYKLVLLNFEVKFSNPGSFLSIYVMFFLSTFLIYILHAFIFIIKFEGDVRGGIRGNMNQKTKALSNTSSDGE